MGVDLYLPSIYDPVAANEDNFRPDSPFEDPVQHMTAIYDKMRATGGYFRNGYNSGDVMWAMGLSWSGVVGPMLTDGRLPIERAQELVALVEAHPLTDERLGRVYLAELTNGVDLHPVQRMLDRVLAEAIGDDTPKAPPDFEFWAGFVRKRREELLALLRKSIELAEPLECSL